MSHGNPSGGDGSRGRKRGKGEELPPAESSMEEGAGDGGISPRSTEEHPPAEAGGKDESSGARREGRAETTPGPWAEGRSGEGEEGPATVSVVPPEEAALREELAAVQADLDRLKDQHLRLAADFENYRKRMNQELASTWVRAQAELIRSLVEVVDDLERVREHAGSGGSNGLVEGVGLVERKLQKVLADAGLVALNPVGELFDPSVMEAVARIPATDPAQEDRVEQVYQKGYRFREHLVRPARVSVFKTED